MIHFFFAPNRTAEYYSNNIRHSNIADLPDGAPISIENLIVHVMAKGNFYYLKERRFFAGLKETQLM